MPKRWIVTVDTSVAPLDAIVSRLVAAGARIEDKLGEIGVVVITGDDLDRGRIAQIEGVQAVEADQQVSVGPPVGGPT